jgi:hypothetical protein
LDNKTANTLKRILEEFPSIVNNIDEHIMKIISDDVIDMNDLPQIILLIKDVMNINVKELKILKVKRSEVIVLIEKIIVILIETNVIKTGNNKDSFLASLRLGIQILDAGIDASESLGWSCCC